MKSNVLLVLAVSFALTAPSVRAADNKPPATAPDKPGLSTFHIGNSLTGTTATGGDTSTGADSGQNGTSSTTTTPRFLTTTASTFRPGSKRIYALTVRLNREARVVLTIRNSHGKIVRQIRVDRHKAGSVLQLGWDGKDARGHYVTAGPYALSVSALGAKGYTRTSRVIVSVLKGH